MCARYFFSQFWKELSFDVLKTFHEEDYEQRTERILNSGLKKFTNDLGSTSGKKKQLYQLKPNAEQSFVGRITAKMLIKSFMNSKIKTEEINALTRVIEAADPE